MQGSLWSLSPQRALPRTRFPVRSCSIHPKLLNWLAHCTCKSGQEGWHSATPHHWSQVSILHQAALDHLGAYTIGLMLQPCELCNLCGILLSSEEVPLLHLHLFWGHLRGVTYLQYLLQVTLVWLGVHLIPRPKFPCDWAKLHIPTSWCFHSCLVESRLKEPEWFVRCSLH